jgi:hypothetical protein
MEAPSPNPALNRTPAQPEFEQLSARHHAVLLRRQLRDTGIDWGASGTYLMFKVTQSIHAPMFAREIARHTTRP